MKKPVIDDSKRGVIFAIFAMFVYLFFGIMAFPSKESVGDFNVVYYILCGVFTVLILMFLYFDELKKEAKDFFKKPFSKILKCFLIAVLFMVIIIVGNNLTYMITKESFANSRNLIFPNMKLLFWYTVFVMVIYTPFVESIIFNKSLSKVIKNRAAFVIVSGVCFGLLQVGVDASNLMSVISALPYVVIGIIISFIYVKKQNTFFPIFIWFFYYAFQVIVQSSAYWS